MATDRKKIIVEEINYWKKSRLLPEKYCDFLLALYSEGEGTTRESFRLSQRITWTVTYYILNFLMLPLSFVIIHFTENDIILQMVLLSVFVLLSGLQFWWIHKQNGLIYIPLSVTLLLIFLLTTTVGAYYLETLYVFLISLANAAGWYFTGIRFNMVSLKIISLVFAAGLILYVLF